MHIAGKVAIVTGGARGFGKAFSEAILSRGGKVCFVDTNVAVGAETLTEFRKKYGEQSSVFVKCDVTNETEFKDVFRHAKDKFRQVHIVINNAGILNENSWDKMIDINLKGMMLGTYLAVEHMRKDKGGEGGLVINVASAAGLTPVFFMPAYAASKFGVVGFTRSFAMNPFYTTNHGISFACLCPAFSDTAMLQETIYQEKPPILHPEAKDLCLATIERLGINSVQDVVNGFIELVETENNNGAVVQVEKIRGIRYRYGAKAGKL